VLIVSLYAAGSSAQSCGCTADESCCSDDKGYACCVDQVSFCVPPNASVAKEFPARCCPQWTVGCSTGSVGCCDPARPWQRTLTETAAPRTSASITSAGKVGAEGTRTCVNTSCTVDCDPTHSPCCNGTGRCEYDPVFSAMRCIPPAPLICSSNREEDAAASFTVYALFTTTTASGISCLTLDSATGAISKSLPVSGPAGVYFTKLYGESTRVFPFDSKRQKFFFLDIVQQFASPTSSITLYGIDPATGSSTATPVKGATGFVMSFVYHPESGDMVMAVGSRSDATTKFYRVNLDTAEATLMASLPRGASEGDSASYYAPYMSAVGSDITQVLRLGYKQVTKGIGPGLGVTSLVNRGSGPSTVWTDVPSIAGEEFFYSVARQAGTDTLLSLAPSTSVNHTFAVVAWHGTAAKVVAHINDAHPPETDATGVLGYVADYATADAWVAMVVDKEPSILPGLKDRWEVISVDLVSGNSNTAVISGKNFELLGAETVSVSGVGIKSGPTENVQK